MELLGRTISGKRQAEKTASSRARGSGPNLIPRLMIAPMGEVARRRTGEGSRRWPDWPNPSAYFFSSGFGGGGVVPGLVGGLAAAGPRTGRAAGAVSSELQPTKQTSASTRLESIAPTLIPNLTVTDALLRKSRNEARRLKLAIPDDTFFWAVRPKDFTGNDLTLFCLRVEL